MKIISSAFSKYSSIKNLKSTEENFNNSQIYGNKKKHHPEQTMGQRRSQREANQKCNIPATPMGCRRGSSKGDLYREKLNIKNERKISNQPHKLKPQGTGKRRK